MFKLIILIILMFIPFILFVSVIAGSEIQEGTNNFLSKSVYTAYKGFINE